VIPLWGFLGVAVPLVLIPGASTAVVLRNSMNGGTRAGVETAIGANAGSVCFGVLCAFGFSLVVQQWPTAWAVLRVCGIAYLAWLGVQSIWRALVPRVAPRGSAAFDSAAGAATARRHVRDGFITNVTNPALATFYFVILPQFIPRDAPIAQTALLLTAVHVALAFTWHAAWAAAGGTLARVLSAGRPRQALDLVAGVALLLLALESINPHTSILTLVR
jgi:threonine/homoserine/homoserine lactone efflux protein